MRSLKGVIFSIRNVVVSRGNIDPELFLDLARLMRWLRANRVQPVFVGNAPWSARMENGETQNLEDVLATHWGPMPWYIAERGDMPFKPRADAMAHVLAKHVWRPDEVVYVGNTDLDMKTARNGGLLFLNASWYCGEAGTQSRYGFHFESPSDIARFIDCFYFCFHSWFWALETGDLRVYAVAPFSTMPTTLYSDARQYSHHARKTAKKLGGNSTFWGQLLTALVFRSSVSKEISFVTAYPGHSPNSGKPVVNDALKILSDSLRRAFLPNLIVRHAEAINLRIARKNEQTIGCDDQINTIRLNPNPIRDGRGTTYADPPLRVGKTVLVVDDFCTEGNSFEAARAYVHSTGAKAICLAWLKTINSNYRELTPLPKLRPYKTNIADEPECRLAHRFGEHILNPDAAADLQHAFRKYYDWAWP